MKTVIRTKTYFPPGYFIRVDVVEDNVKGTNEYQLNAFNNYYNTTITLKTINIREINQKLKDLGVKIRQ